MAEGINRQTDLKLKLGSDQLESVWLDAHESLSQHFSVTLDILSTLGPIDLVPYLGKVGSIEVLVEGERSRYFHGVVVKGRFLAEYPGAGHVYRLTLMPQAHFHCQGKNYRIFQEVPARDIIKTVLDKCKIDHEIKALGGTTKREYCVQYGESDFAFVSRLMEEEGLYYFYQHKSDKHVLVICDDPAGHPRLGDPVLTYNHSIAGTVNADAGASTFVHNWVENVASGAEQKVTYRDYNFEEPGRVLESVVTEREMHPLDAIEVYEWRGHFRDEAYGKKLADFVLDSRRAQRQTFDGETQYVGIQTGHTFKLKEHEVDRYNDTYLIISSHTSIAAEMFRPGMQNKGANHVRFTTIFEKVQFRAPIAHARPVVKGPETAVVTGPDGEEIYTDKYGRIKVHFFWDRDQAADENSSCWIRVSQTGGLGNIIIPRVGHEVLVDFIAGDPDEPIVVGRVFNSTFMPAYALPANKTMAVWSSKTYKQDSGSDLAGAKALDTGQPGKNEIRFEDKQGGEEVMLHAERTLTTRVRLDESHHVGHDQIIDIGHDRIENVLNDEKITIGKNRTEDVGDNETITIGIDQTETIGGKRTQSVAKDDKLDVGNDQKIDIGNTLTITAKSKITLQVGGSSIVLEPTSITINTIKLEMEGSASAKLNGAMTNVEASGMLIAKGSVVMIN